MGIYNVEDWLENDISWSQLRKWLAYSQLEPFGEERADLRMGILASVIANCNRDPKKGQPYKPSDFIPKFGAEHKEKGPITDADLQKYATMLKSMGKPIAVVPD